MTSSYTVLKRCDCPKAKQPKCSHPFYFHCHPRGGRRWRFNLNDEVGQPIASVSEAHAQAAAIYKLVVDGQFVPRAARVATQAVAPAAAEPSLTLDQFALKYVARVSKVRQRNKSWKDDESKFRVLGAFTWDDAVRGQQTRLGALPMSAITEDDLEEFFAKLRERAAAATVNNYVTLVKKAFRWAGRKGFTAASPISEDSEIKRGKPRRRHRRLDKNRLLADGTLVAGTEMRLLRFANEKLAAIITAALDTCCRLGELLKLQWADVDLHEGQFRIRAENAKDDEARLVPLTDRLWTLLKAMQVDPAGVEYGPTAYVFGDCGLEPKSIRTAWETCLLWAHGVTPAWIGPGQGLTKACLAALAQIDLRFHDLRHEGASRLYFERGWTLAEVQELLGHASIETTRIYLNIEQGGLLTRMRATEAAARVQENLTQTDTGMRPAVGQTSRKAKGAAAVSRSESMV